MIQMQYFGCYSGSI